MDISADPCCFDPLLLLVVAVCVSGSLVLPCTELAPLLLAAKGPVLLLSVVVSAGPDVVLLGGRPRRLGPTALDLPALLLLFLLC